jgi:hypothetical protein
MIRITFSCPEDLSDRLDEYAKIFAQGELEDNKSAILQDLIRKHIPTMLG